jgi:hypothetical protein
MHKTSFVAALALALMVSGTAFAQSSSTAPNPSSLSGGPKETQQPAPTVNSVTQDLQKAGFTNVRVLEDAFLIQAKTKDGTPIMMTIGPNGMSALEVSNGSGQARATDPTSSNNNVTAAPAQSAQK